MSELSGMQTVLLLGLAGLASLYVCLFRVWLTVAAGADLLFVSALAACVASIAVPSVFAFSANQVVGASPLPPVLASADARLDALEALPSEIVANALARIGYSPEADEIAAEAVSKPAPGRIEGSVRPAVERPGRRTPALRHLRGLIVSLAGRARAAIRHHDDSAASHHRAPTRCT